MSSATPTPIAKSSKPQILLVPYDADSPEHVQRLVEQRIACGWEHESVPQCTAAHRTGELTLQWAVSKSPFHTLSLKLLEPFLF